MQILGTTHFYFISDIYIQYPLTRCGYKLQTAEVNQALTFGFVTFVTFAMTI